MKRSEGKNSGFSESFVTGVVAIVFLIIGYQTALFVHQAAVMKIAANRDDPDTVFVYVPYLESLGSGENPMAAKEETHLPEPVVRRKNAPHTSRADAVRNNVPRKMVECFSFNPNTATVDELCRLGFTPKQAQSIDNYRLKGGRFLRKSDFQKSYVVSDSIFMRLSPYIDIPPLDLNLADSADLECLPGIGAWYVSKIIEHRNALGGFSYKEQLMDVYRLDQEKYDGLSDLVTVSGQHVRPYPIWILPADSLRKHPYIRTYEVARSIVLYKEHNPPEAWTIKGLCDAGILSEESAYKLAKCALTGNEKSTR